MNHEEYCEIICQNSTKQEYREIMAEFQQMNSQMKSWMNSFILN